MVWHDAASEDALAGAQPWLRLRVAGVRLVVAAVDGAWYGVEDRRSHAGCAFSEDAELEGADIVCSCHGSEFDIRTGDVLRGPAEDAIRAFPVRVFAGRVEVDL